MASPDASRGPLPADDHFRFHAPHAHLSSAFGSDWFGTRAETFARFFGTPTFLIAQTFIVAVWIGLNVANVTQFDIYPFILLNLAFSLQAAYAAPLILLAQTRQADRDKAHEDAAARHREELAGSQSRLLEENTTLTRRVAELSSEIDDLTRSIHERVVASSG